MPELSIERTEGVGLEIYVRAGEEQLPLAILTITESETGLRLELETPDAVRPNLIWERRTDPRNDEVRTLVICDLVTENEALLLDVSTPPLVDDERHILQSFTEEKIADLYDLHPDWAEIVPRLDEIRRLFLQNV